MVRNICYFKPVGVKGNLSLLFFSRGLKQLEGLAVGMFKVEGNREPQGLPQEEHKTFNDLRIYGPGELAKFNHERQFHRWPSVTGVDWSHTLLS